MAYTNQNWIDESKKPWGGEQQVARVLFRLNDAGNWIYAPSNMVAQYSDPDEAEENSYGDVPTTATTYTNVWEHRGATITLDKSSLPTLTGYNQTVYAYRVQSTGTSSSDDHIVFKNETGIFEPYDSLLFSLHVSPYDAGSVNGGDVTSGFSIAIENTTNDEQFKTTWNWTGASRDLAFVTADTALEVYGSELVQGEGNDSWYRVWIGYNMPEDDTADQFSVSFYPNPSGDTGGYSVCCAPQLEVCNLVDRDTPAWWIEEQKYEQAGTLITLSGEYSTLSINPIVQRREREFGVVQGQNTQLTIPNPQGTLMSYEMEDCWCEIQSGFEALDEWQTVAVGRIHNAEARTDGRIYMTVDCSLVNLMEYTLPRGFNFKCRTEAPFSGIAAASEISTVSTADESEEYKNDYGYAVVGYKDPINILDSDEVVDQTYKVVFVDNKNFKVQFEDGSFYMDSATYLPKYFNIGAAGITEDDKEDYADDAYNAEIGASEYGDPVISINWKGWNQDSDKYVAGDTFEFTTTAARSEYQLTYMGMVKHLIEDVVGVKVFDVSGNAFYSSPFANATQLDTYITGNEQGERYLAGEWNKGDSVIEMIQDLLKIIHGAIYTSEDGTIGFWCVDLANTPSITVVGDQSMVGNTLSDGLDIAEATHARTKENYANVVTLSYVDLYTGQENTYTRSVPTPEYLKRHLEISTKWNLPAFVAIDACSVALTRFGQPKETYTLRTTLAAGVQVDLDKSIMIYEPDLNLYGVEVDVIERHFDVNQNTFTLVGWNDPISMLNYARCDVDVCDDPEAVCR